MIKMMAQSVIWQQRAETVYVKAIRWPQDGFTFVLDQQLHVHVDRFVPSWGSYQHSFTVDKVGTLSAVFI